MEQFIMNFLFISIFGILYIASRLVKIIRLMRRYIILDKFLFDLEKSGKSSTPEFTESLAEMNKLGEKINKLGI